MSTHKLDGTSRFRQSLKVGEKGKKKWVSSAHPVCPVSRHVAYGVSDLAR